VWVHRATEAAEPSVNQLTSELHLTQQEALGFCGRVSARASGWRRLLVDRAARRITSADGRLMPSKKSCRREEISDLLEVGRRTAPDLIA
jgi:hypothetical protein